MDSTLLFLRVQLCRFAPPEPNRKATQYSSTKLLTLFFCTFGIAELVRSIPYHESCILSAGVQSASLIIGLYNVQYLYTYFQEAIFYLIYFCSQRNWVSIYEISAHNLYPCRAAGIPTFIYLFLFYFHYTQVHSHSAQLARRRISIFDMLVAKCAFFLLTLSIQVPMYLFYFFIPYPYMGMQCTNSYVKLFYM